MVSGSPHAGDWFKCGAKIVEWRGLKPRCAAKAGKSPFPLQVIVTFRALFEVSALGRAVVLCVVRKFFRLKNRPFPLASHFFQARYLHERSNAVPLHHQNEQRSVRLGVRTVDFHSTNRGSIPLRTTKKALTAMRGPFSLFSVAFSAAVD